VVLSIGSTSQEDRVYIADGRLWKLISIIQSGDIQIDYALSQRCLRPLRISEDQRPIEVIYPPIPTRLLEGVEGAVFPIETAAATAIEMIAALILESLVLQLFNSDRERGYRLSTNYGRALSDISREFDRSGVLPDRSRTHYLERSIDEFLHRIVRSSVDPANLGSIAAEEIHRLIRDFVHTPGIEGRSFFMHDLAERFEYLLRGGLERGMFRPMLK
jgi:hypothetical protein